MYRGYALIAPMACTGAMWRMLRVGRILICVHTTNKDCLLLLLLMRARGGQSQNRNTSNTCRIPEEATGDGKPSTKVPKPASYACGRGYCGDTAAS